MRFIERLEISNVGCIKNASIRLTPLHALIGPNDSGKTTTLRAIHAALLSAHTVAEYERRGFGVLLNEVFDPKRSARVSIGLGDVSLALTRTPDTQVMAKFRHQRANGEDVLIQDSVPGSGLSLPQGYEHVQFVRARRSTNDLVAGQAYPMALDADVGSLFAPDEPLTLAIRAFVEALRRPRLLRLDPDVLRAPAPLLKKGEALFFRDERGRGLAAVLDALRDSDENRFLEITARLHERFPFVKRLQLDRSDDGSEKAISIRLKDDTIVPAALMSEGLLYFLAFLVVEKLEPAVFLIEEPENGLHPARVGEVMDVLRAMSATSQILIATHSPLIVNELEATEVTVLRRTEEAGTAALLLSETADFERRSKIYAPGELWLNYANGIDESSLVNGGPRT